MGTFIYADISKAVTEDEWESVYQETLLLARAFPLAELRTVEINGISTPCLVRTEERQAAWGNGKSGWYADGDYESTHTAETYYVPKELLKGRDVIPEAGDAMLARLPAYLDYSWDEPLCSKTISLWDAKTQGEPYHIYMLAVACLIEARLGDKAYIYGDITIGQCRRAVDLANEYLEEPIHLPSSCSEEQLLKRVKALPIEEWEQLVMFIRSFLGTKKARFGEYLRSHFSEKALRIYWRRKFTRNVVGRSGFGVDAKNYLEWGFPLEGLCSYATFEEECALQYETLVRWLMESKVYVEEKDCSDILEIDPESQQPYGVRTQIERFAFGGFRNKKVDRYVPIDELRNVLEAHFGSKCNVGRIIDDILAKEAGNHTCGNGSAGPQDRADWFRELKEAEADAVREARKEYTITEPGEVMAYQEGDTIIPDLERVLTDYYSFYHSLTGEEMFKKLMSEPAHKRCEWLVQQNTDVLIRDCDWRAIFDDIEKNSDSFSRYYPAVRVKLMGSAMDYVKAFCTNRALYNHIEMLSQGK